MVLEYLTGFNEKKDKDSSNYNTLIDIIPELYTKKSYLNDKIQKSYISENLYEPLNNNILQYDKKFFKNDTDIYKKSLLEQNIIDDKKEYLNFNDNVYKKEYLNINSLESLVSKYDLQDYNPGNSYIKTPSKKPSTAYPDNVFDEEQSEISTLPSSVPELAPPRELLADIQSQHPGATFIGARVMQDPSKHPVHIYSFRLLEDGKERYLQLIGKDTLGEEVRIAAAVQSLGIPTYQTITSGTHATFIEYLGDKTAAQKLEEGDHTAITGVVETLGEFHARTDDLENLITVAHVSPVQNFFERFVSRMADTKIITPTQARLLQAYQHFTASFSQSGISHGDAHLRNFVYRDASSDYGMIDFETVAHTTQIFDLARVANSASEVVGEDVAGDIIFPYMQRSQLTDANQLLEELSYAQVADNLLKVGDRIAIAQNQPRRRDEKEEQARITLEKAQKQLHSLASQKGTHSTAVAQLQHALNEFLEEQKEKRLLISA